MPSVAPFEPDFTAQILTCRIGPHGAIPVADMSTDDAQVCHLTKALGGCVHPKHPVLMHDPVIAERYRVEDVAAALYCLGVTNSNNLLQKVRQGKIDTFGIGKDGRRNGKGKSGA